MIIAAFPAKGENHNDRNCFKTHKDSAWINNLHRKAHPSIIADRIPSPQEMKTMLEAVGMKIDTLRDDEHGYFLSAVFD